MFHHTTLNNGLEIIAECNDAAYSLAVSFFVKTGSRDETDNVAGVSHFLEHMMFKGTPTRSAADVNRELDELGAYANAYTSEETTCYYAMLLPELQDRIIDLLGDILRPSLRPQDFDTEKQVILEEIRMYDDQPPFGADEMCREIFFGDHPLRRSVLGTCESVENLTAGQMREYFEQRYSPGNIVLAAAGNVNFDALVRQTEKACGDWKMCEMPRELKRPRVVSGFKKIYKESAAQQYVMQMFNGVGGDETSRERYAAFLLTHVIGDEVGSRFYWDLLDTGKADSCSFGMTEYTDAGVYIMSLSCAPELVQENMEHVQAIYDAINTNGITEEELTRNKTKILSRMALANEQPSNRLFAFANEWLQECKYYTPREELNFVQNVTISDVRDVLSKYPINNPYTISIGPKE
ncbi:MAG: insulinase family protein [Planctomycetaceae bacterium]|jgi:predicted Zn-dependent peptidase|nr:insulinase family protein [Planctomycetaceae bacterium]